MGNADKLLLIGASGRVGGLVRSAWRIAPPPDFEVLAQYRHPPVLTVQGDIVWDPLVGRFPVPRENLCDRLVMVVLAGVVPGPNAPLHRNSEIALGCVQVAHQLGIKRVLIASSSSVYGTDLGHPLRESDTPQGVNDYGISKLAMEAAVNAAAGELDICFLRIGNVLGADALLLNAANASREKPLLLDQFESGGGPVRSYIDPQTLAAALASLARQNGRLPKVLNVAAPRPITMQAIAEGAGIPWQWRTAKEGAIERIVLDCSALGAIHPFGPADSEPVRMLTRLAEVKNIA